MSNSRTTLSLRVSCDAPASTALRVSGSVPELGAWDVAKAVALVFDANSRLWRADVVLSGAPSSIDFKLAANRSGGAWEWQPGANRCVKLSPSGETIASLSWLCERDGTTVIGMDPWLEQHRGHLAHRYSGFTSALARIEEGFGSLDAFSRGYEVFGFNRDVKDGVPGIRYREWAPGAKEAFLIGDFNAWGASATPLQRDDFGVWSTFLPDRNTMSGSSNATALLEEAIPHNSYVRLSLTLADGSRVNRLPAYVRYAVYDEKLNEYVAKYWNPPPASRHAWVHDRPVTHVADDYAQVPGCLPIPSRTAWKGTVGPTEAALCGVMPSSSPSSSPPPPSSACIVRALDALQGASARAAPPPRDPAAAGLRVYEAHVGMAGEEGKVSSYRDFAANVLPRIKACGYNCVQLMAVMEHAYYGSFGYHVTSFLAPSSRFGTPEDLKFLVDAAHGAGLLIIMDCVHSHASKNSIDGLNELDGTDFQYFHSGARGRHELWDSRLFDYSKLETQRLLLSSLRLFADEFRFDGFRFDGVTSMMYTHHGLSYGFSGNYNEYFGEYTDLDAVNYLQLANHLLHTLSPPCISIAEDVSGMPTLGRPVWEGGVGFDYRLAMAVPDVWIKLLKETPDEDWDLESLARVLMNRRSQEKCIAYAESHDQALVGDKTIAFWLMDKEMYFHMSAKEKPRHPVIDRGLALHKMIRLVTYALGGEGWLNFIGNEFGHPEWIDFPRIGNDWSYHYCRRQWSLVDNPDLLYGALASFDGAMHALEDSFPWLESRVSYASTMNNADKVLVFERGSRDGTLIFAFNFHATSSYTDYRIGSPTGGCWVVALDSDASAFAGYARVDGNAVYEATDFKHAGRPYSLRVYLPARTVLVFKTQAEGGH